jgi:hypothetical protein
MTVVCAALLLALGAASAVAANENSEGHARDLAAKQCAAEKKADKGAFKAFYGEHAMRACIKGETPEVADELKNAAKECKAERSGDPEGFAEDYGDGRNAFGKCVSRKVRAEIREDVAEFKNAAKECKAERELDPEGFRGDYGSNANGRNALGKCVSEKVRASEEGEAS